MPEITASSCLPGGFICQEIKQDENAESGFDHFNNQETDLLKTNAMRSSLWEIDTLRHHYCPPVSRFVLSLENDLTVRSKTTEVGVKDFSSASYATVFREEVININIFIYTEENENEKPDKS